MTPFELVELSTGIRYTIYDIKQNSKDQPLGLAFIDGVWKYVSLSRFIPLELAEEFERNRHSDYVNNYYSETEEEEDELENEYFPRVPHY